MIIFTAICFMMAFPAKMTAQDVAVVDLSLLHEMIEGREVRARYIFLESFAYGEKGMELFDRADRLAKEYVLKKPLSDDPQKILDEFRKRAIGRRSWLEVNVLGKGYYAVRNKSGWGVMRVDGSFVMQLGSFEDIGGHNDELMVFAAWKPGKNRCGIVSYDGQELSDFIYSHVNPTNPGYAVATLASGDQQVLLIPEGSGANLFYKPVCEPYYVINHIDCYDENDVYYPIFYVMDADLCYGVIDRSGKLVIPMIYNRMDRSTGRKFGHDPDHFMYLRARRSEGSKDYYDYFYAKSLKLVHTCEAE